MSTPLLELRAATTLCPPRVGVREFTVVLEDVRSQFKVFGEGLQGLDEKVTRIDRDLGLVKAVVLDHSRELREIRSAVKRVEDALEKKVDRDEVEPIVERVVARARRR